MNSLTANIIITIAGILAIGVIIQINTMLMLRQWQAFKADKDPADAFRINIPQFIQQKKLEEEILKRG